MEAFWFFLAVLTSLSHSFKWVLQKAGLKNINSNTLVFVLSGLSVIFWLPFVIYTWIPELTTKLIWVFVLSWVLLYIWKLFSFKALQAEDILTFKKQVQFLEN